MVDFPASLLVFGGGRSWNLGFMRKQSNPVKQANLHLGYVGAINTGDFLFIYSNLNEYTCRMISLYVPIKRVKGG